MEIKSYEIKSDLRELTLWDIFWIWIRIGLIRVAVLLQKYVLYVSPPAPPPDLAEIIYPKELGILVQKWKEQGMQAWEGGRVMKGFR